MEERKIAESRIVESQIIESLLSQYQASLKMLRQAIELCPEDLWIASTYHNRYWHVAYHTLFYAHLYVNASEAEFAPWTKHRPECRLLGSRPGEALRERVVPEPYAKAELLDYQKICCDEVLDKVPRVSLDAPSGFDWLPFNRFEVHLYNLRHIHHHTGQLADRLRTAAGIGLPWVRSGV
jgi:hypothetical protein